MELNFDKEMDAILRQAARQDIFARPAAAAGAAEAQSAHLDADELSAFAANALPGKARERAMGHLADCGNCRTILANLSFFEAAEEKAPAEAAASPAAAAIGATVAVPFFDRIKNFFALPVLAYGMGALVLMFSGLFVVVMLNSRSGNTDVAQMEQSPVEKPAMSKAAADDGAQYVTETPSEFAANSAANAPANMALAANTAASGAYAPSQSGPIANSNTSVATKSETFNGMAGTGIPSADASSTLDGADKDLKTASPVMAAPPPPPPPAAAMPKPAEQENRAQQAYDDEYLNRSRNNSRDMRPDGATRNSPEKKSSMPGSMMGGASRAAGDRADEPKRKESASMTVRGKQFRREGSVWIDFAYRGGAVVNITRGSKEYKKLDGDVKKTANDLGGTVIIVHKGTAYRIQ